LEERCRRVDLVVRFEGTMPTRPLLPFAYATRQLIANEVVLASAAGRAPVDGRC